MPGLSEYLTGIINSAADANGIPRDIAYALQHKENASGDPNIVSPANNNGSHDYGLFQLNDHFFPGAPNMTPQDNATTAMGLLASLYAKFGNWYDALRGYNAGATGASRNPNISSAYANDILANVGNGGDVVTAVQTGGIVSPNAIIQGAHDMGIVDANATGNSASSPKPGTNPGAPPTVGQSIAQNVQDAVTNSIKGLTTSFKSYFDSNGLQWAFIILGGGLVVIAAIHILEGAPGVTPKAIPIPV